MRETVIEIAESVRRGERKAVEVLDDTLAAVAAGNDRLNAFVHLDEGLAAARPTPSTPRWRPAGTPGRSPACRSA